MTIRLLSPISVAGVAKSIGDIITGDPAWEADQVNANNAVYTHRALVQGEGLVDAQLLVRDGHVKLVGPNSTYRLARSGLVGYEQEQPAEIADAVTQYGRLACRFGSGQWTAILGSPTLTQGYTGWDGAGNKTGITSRTGQPDMLKVVPAANTTEQISLGTFATNMLTPSLAGKFGLWLYIDTLPSGFGLGVEMGTGTPSSNNLYFGFNGNQIRAGWNFLKFVMRNPNAYVDSSGVEEYHPFGISAQNYGSGASADILNNPITYIRIDWTNGVGATLYFDSVWTAFSSQCQIVLGCDGGVGLEEYAVPIFDQYGWVAYHAAPIRVNGSFGVVTDLNNPVAVTNALQQRLHAKGWDIINHTANHLSNGTLTSEAQIAYELETARGWQHAIGCPRGAEFYASPQSSTSALAEKVIKSLGFKIQRHARHWNVSVTPFGIDNPHHIGAIDMGSNTSGGVTKTLSGATSSVTGFQTATKIKRAIDIAVAYGDTLFPFWHGITITGDSGSGNDLTGDDLLLTRSAFESVLAYIRQLEAAGSVRVPRGITGFWYGD